jgi:signal transduction histidine kinase
MFSAARWRLTGVFTVVLAVILLIAGVAIYLTTSSVLFARVDDDLEERAVRDLSQFVGDGRGPPGRGPGGDDFVPHTKTTGGYFYAIVGTDGEELLSSSNVDPDGLAPSSTLQTALDDGTAFVSTRSSEGESLRVYVLQAQTQDGSPVLAQIGRSTEPEHSALSQLRTVLLGVFVGSVIPAAFAGFILSGRVLRPIQTAMDSQQTFIADASHELRTPVAVVRTNAELLQSHIARSPDASATDVTAVEDILSESDRLGKMVDQMLTLAQTDAGENSLHRTDLSLDQIADEVTRSMTTLATARGVALAAHTNGAVEMRGDPDRLRELLVVLLDNAIKYTDSGGIVDVTVERNGKKATLDVADTGRGIPPEALSHIFDRFYRVDKARSRESGGTGLGLAIAKQIVDAHDGTIRIDSDVGKGTRVTVELPA